MTTRLLPRSRSKRFTAVGCVFLTVTATLLLAGCATGGGSENGDDSVASAAEAEGRLRCPAESDVSSGELTAEALCLDGIVVGATTRADLEAGGYEVEPTRYLGREVGAVRFDGRDYYLNEEGIVQYLVIEYPADRYLPAEWEAVGIDRTMGWDEWLAFFDRRASDHKVSVPPHREMMAGFLVGESNPPQHHVDDEGQIQALIGTTPRLSIWVGFQARRRPESAPEEVSLSASKNLMVTIAKYPIHRRPPSNPMVSVPPEVRQGIGLSLILARDNGAFLDELAMIGHPELERERVEAMLERDWGVTSQESFRSTLDNLVENGHSAAWEDLRALIPADRDEESLRATILQNGMDPHRAMRFLYVVQMERYAGETALKAWDLGRAATLVRWGYDLKYFSRQEAHALLVEFAEELYPRYSSWENFAAHYVMGRMFWAPHNHEDNGNDAIEYAAEFLHDANSIWNDEETWWEGNPDTPSGTMGLEDALYFPTREAMVWGKIYDFRRAVAEGDLERASRTLERVVSKALNLPALDFERGLLHAHLQEHAASRDAFSSYTTAIPGDSRGWVELGLAHERLGTYSAAYEAYTRGVGAGGESATLLILKGRAALSGGDFFAARSDLEQAMAELSDDPRHGQQLGRYGHYLLAYALVNLDALIEAREHIQIAMSEFGNDPFLSYALGLSYLEDGDRDEATAARYLRDARSLGYELPESVLRWLEFEAPPAPPDA